MPPRTGEPVRRSRLRTKLLLAVGAAVATLAAVEAGLRVLAPLPPTTEKRMHRFLPSYHAMSPAPRIIEFDPGPLPNVTPGIRRVQVNRHGFLYPEADGRRRDPSEIRIAAIGGSTVECAVLPEQTRWPEALGELLRRDFPDRRVTVLNLGLSAIDTRTHLATTSQLVPSLGVDVVVFMLGANDLCRVSEREHLLLSEADFYPPESPLRALRSVLRDTQIKRHLDAAAEARERQPRTTRYFEEQARWRQSLPELTTPMRIAESELADYATGIVTLAGICREHGIVPLFTTQPTMLTATPTPAEEASLWGIEIHGHRVPAATFIALLDQLNERLLATCTQRGYAAVDLATRIPKGLGSFYDQVHFTEVGARQVAAELAPVVRELLASHKR